MILSFLEFTRGGTEDSTKDEDNDENEDKDENEDEDVECKNEEIN